MEGPVISGLIWPFLIAPRQQMRAPTRFAALLGGADEVCLRPAELIA